MRSPGEAELELPTPGHLSDGKTRATTDACERQTLSRSRELQTLKRISPKGQTLKQITPKGQTLKQITPKGQTLKPIARRVRR
ncbi:hypothetical protein Bcav_2333 [Beutenbergia cavernae DSM 12333]|uniref:Uncharacterized protein n=1 Tax=Beutenbergia cavernae (strain ATCC BAA-8 / DSM 12333 / CCUG 43141 / JCM 11478 / NBRC 16432 / NCIMB 13614 / HKI 0122) TaxID=471853 RepID=C5BVY3_BEUC1|nr:hypothetical protein Bcav_2333 [Beutenbergia cavernae DSM 12333]